MKFKHAESKSEALSIAIKIQIEFFAKVIETTAEGLRRLPY